MRLKEFRSGLSQQKPTLAAGSFLLVLGAVLALVVLHFDRVLGFARLVGSALTPLLCGLVIAFVLNVFVRFFEDVAFAPLKHVQNALWRKLRYPLCVVLAYLVVVLLLAFLVGFILPSFVDSLTGLADTLQRTLPGTLTRAAAWATDFASRHDLDFLIDYLRDFNWTSLLARITEFTTDLLGMLVSMTTNVASGVFTLLMGFFFSVYMLFGKQRLLGGIRSTLKAYLPASAAARLQTVGTLTNKVFYSFVRGQLTECVILGGLCYAGMRLLGLDYALLISSVVALTALIPILGAYIGCATGVVVLLLVHPMDALVFLVFLVVLQQVEGNLIYPRVVGSSIGLPPVWTLFAVLFWGGVLGIPGIIVGTPATAVLYRLLRTSVYDRLAAQNPPSPASPEE